MKDVGKFILLPFRIFMAIWYILWSFWCIFPVLVNCAKKYLATPMQSCLQEEVTALCDVATLERSLGSNIIKVAHFSYISYFNIAYVGMYICAKS
jgi:hypothetical protein